MWPFPLKKMYKQRSKTKTMNSILYKEKFTSEIFDVPYGLRYWKKFLKNFT